MPNDMLVKLYNLKPTNCFEELEKQGILIKRALIIDKPKILEFVKTNFNDNWANECEYSLFNSPISCYIAAKNKEIIGFSCYDATFKNFFGPIGVAEAERQNGVGKALLYKCLNSMKELGYGYAIIGWVGGATEFYKKEVSAIVIEDSFPGIYKNLIESE